MISPAPDDNLWERLAEADDTRIGPEPTPADNYELDQRIKRYRAEARICSRIAVFFTVQALALYISCTGACATVNFSLGTLVLIVLIPLGTGLLISGGFAGHALYLGVTTWTCLTWKWRLLALIPWAVLSFESAVIILVVSMEVL